MPVIHKERTDTARTTSRLRASLRTAGHWCVWMLDRHVLARWIVALTLTGAHIVALMNIPPTPYYFATGIGIAAPGLVVILASRKWATIPRWLAVWFVIMFINPIYAFTVALIAESWAFERSWRDARGLREVITYTRTDGLYESLTATEIERTSATKSSRKPPRNTRALTKHSENAAPANSAVAKKTAGTRRNKKPRNTSVKHSAKNTVQKDTAHKRPTR